MGAAIASVRAWDGVGGSNPEWLLLLLAEGRVAPEVLYGLAGECLVGGSPLLLPAYRSDSHSELAEFPPATIPRQTQDSNRKTNAAMTGRRCQSLPDGVGISLLQPN